MKTDKNTRQAADLIAVTYRREEKDPLGFSYTYTAHYAKGPSEVLRTGMQMTQTPCEGARVYKTGSRVLLSDTATYRRMRTDDSYTVRVREETLHVLADVYYHKAVRSLGRNCTKQEYATILQICLEIVRGNVDYFTLDRGADADTK